MQRQPHTLRPTLPFPRSTRARRGHASPLHCLAIACTLLLAACQGGSLEQQRETAITATNATLPAPYRDGLVTELARAEGKDVVLDIRFAEARVAQIAAKPQLRDALRADEAQAMPELCGDAALKPFIDAGGSVRRRFIDADGELFFEVRLTPADCPHS